MLNASVNVSLGDLDAYLRSLSGDLDDNLRGIAEEIADEAKRSTAFRDESGKLRKSIKVRKSKFEEGGYLVVASAPHASLVEFGHKQITKTGRVVGKVDARPFLRPARERVLSRLATEFSAGVGVTYWSGE